MSYPSLLSLLTKTIDGKKARILLAVAQDGPEVLHNYSMLLLVKMGWVYGKQFDLGELTHPDIEDWGRLSSERQDNFRNDLVTLEKRYG